MEIQQFRQQDIEILKEETLYQGFFQLKKIQFKHKLFAGGYSGVVTRELLVKGAASAVIAYDPIKDAVVLVEQVRIGAYQPDSEQSPWLLELIAGMVEEGEKPEEVALRESEEEAGVQVQDLQHCLSVWDSPGGVLERIHLFVGKVDSTTAKGLHGLSEENEDIRVHVVSREQAYQWVNEGKIDNSIAVLGLQWLQLNYKTLS
ncbi:ADP-ribose diphosphatase [Pasteurella multocida]|uniref:ADP-ribose diphosphatase n=1 Tax=Pasteurella multocida TaxID=747 RepID=UPI0002828B92|nr:ADP-ribose diphosphatase [Pasteurella multocida]ARB73259.1 ADP-ribose diphosphatase [Pasteurella multocida]EJZ78733.1 ADP-ribose pyrophosphatase [Pasteurella multocida subsp. gallicida X73]MCL7826690.1 ADP-ribose diphosphatase [Pasteurella multocida]OBP27770.1 ADP-ribose pyrophosphatase [Pasteurella multocida subsp. multocida]URH94299.1 ADP-ribose diphosphatase [Pasteurella multocida]